MTTKKYELTTTCHPANPKLFQVKALRNIPEFLVKAGDLGGWIESEANLSQHGDCWVSGNAQVSENGWVSGGALVSGDG